MTNPNTNYDTRSVGVPYLRVPRIYGLRTLESVCARFSKRVQ